MTRPAAPGKKVSNYIFEAGKKGGKTAHKHHLHVLFHRRNRTPQNGSGKAVTIV